MARPTAAQQIAALKAEMKALRAEIVAPKAAKAAEPTLGAFRTKAQRLAGDGWPCTASPACSRTDLRTEGRAKAHGDDGHNAR